MIHSTTLRLPCLRGISVDIRVLLQPPLLHKIRIIWSVAPTDRKMSAILRPAETKLRDLRIQDGHRDGGQFVKFRDGGLLIRERVAGRNNCLRMDVVFQKRDRG